MKQLFIKFLNSKSQRSRLVMANIILGVVVRGTSVVAQLILVPLTIGYITSELYGVWLTLSSIVQWVSFFDIGLGNGLRNKLSECIALDDYNKGRTYVSTTYAIMSIAFFVIGFGMWWIAGFINWSSFLNVSQEYNGILTDVTKILFITFSIQVILKLVQNVLQAFQLNALASLLDALTNIMALLFIFILTRLMAPSLVNVAVAFSLAPIIVLVLASLFFYSQKFRKVSPSIKDISFKFSKDIFNLGGKFFIVQIAGLVLYQTINLIISRLCGPEDVTVYNVAYKYFSVLMMCTTIVLSPMWSAFTDAYVKDDSDWMNNIYNKLIKLFVICFIISVIMVILSPIVYKIWVGEEVYVPFSISLLMGVYMVISVWGNIHSIVISGMGKIKFQVYYSICIMLLFIPLSLSFGEIMGVTGVMFALILVNAPGVFFGPYQVRKLIDKTAKGIWAQ